MTDLERNKQNVVQFYEMMFNRCRAREAAERFLGKWYTQHNPTMDDGKDAFIRHMEQAAVDHPGKKVEIKQVFAEGDFVILHCLQKWPGGGEWATIEIFRLDKDGYIVEHWDVMQPVPAKSKNTNGMF